MWNDGSTLNDDTKSEIRKAVRIHQLIWSGFWFILFLSFIIPAIQTFIMYSEYTFFVTTVFYLIAAIIAFRCNERRIERLDDNYFEWTEAVVTSVDYIGSRVRHSKIHTDIGSFVTGQIIFRFRKDIPVVIIKYNVNQSSITLKENLTFLYDPLAYKISYYER